MKILIGLLALGLVICIHELGHFLAARLCGVEVETFSIGWGPVLFRRKKGKTEYRVSALPIGGYCGMKGEHAFAEAIEKNLDAVPRESGSFFAAHPAKRIIIAFAGPFANLVFAALALAFVSAAGSTWRTYENRIVLSSAYETGSPDTVNPADAAGLASGDRIISINGKPVANYTDIQQAVGTHPEEALPLEYERDGQRHATIITPSLDKKSGSGKIGIYPWVPLSIASVTSGSAAETTGLRAGDLITSVDGVPVRHYIEFEKRLDTRPAQVTVTVDRAGSLLEFPLVLLYGTKGEIESGIEWQTLTVNVPGTGLFASLRNGVVRTGETLGLTVKSLGLLFRGIDLSEAVSGPVRITLMIGEVAQTGLSGLAEFLSIICVSLFLMNLLPIPVLDGGQILFSLVEMVNRHPLKPRTLYYVQFVGIGIIVSIFLFALFGDIRFLTK
jgi:regulator of sigma E protease